MACMFIIITHIGTGKMEKTGFVCQFSSFIEFFFNKMQEKTKCSAIHEKM